MKILDTAPLRAVLAAASIATVGIVAVEMLDTEVTDYGVPVPPESRCVDLPDPPQPPAPPPNDVPHPQIAISH